jgi:hypothetical protein
MTSTFFSIMDKIGTDCLKALSFVEKYLMPAAGLAAIIFPAQTAAITGVVTSIDLVQKAVATVEAKMAAGGAATGTGIQKLADVLSIVSPTVTQLLTAEGIKVDTGQLTSIINAVVAILNVQQAPLEAPATVAA